MELIKRYIYAVQRWFSPKAKEDMGREVESLILDELEEQFGEKENYTDPEITKVLTELGPPMMTAGRYRDGENYVIGPQLYDIYRLILMIAAGAVTMGLLISHIIGIFQLDNEFSVLAKDFLLFFPSLFSALLTMVGAVTIVFYLIQRFGKKITAEFEKEIKCDWNPKDLPELPQKEEIVKITEPIFGIIFIIGGMVLLNTLVYGDQTLLTGKALKIFEIFSLESLRYYAPLWNISLAAGLALNGILIPIGRRDRKVNLVDMLINLFDITAKVVMIKGPVLINTVAVRSNYTIKPDSIIDKFLQGADKYLDRFFIFLIVCTAIAFTVKVVKVIKASGESK